MQNLKELTGQQKYDLLRNEYKEFIFDSYEVKKNSDELDIKYNFVVPGLAEFHPTWKIPYKNIVDANEDAINRLIFNLGMVELVSYWKIACPQNVIIKCGVLTDTQLQWWKKLYYNGLGECFYVNGIEAYEKEFMHLVCDYSKEQTDCTKPVKLHGIYEGCLVPIGGGKDSCVSLEVLKRIKDEKITTYSVNRIEAVKKVIDVTDNKIGDILCRRTLDKTMLQLNSEGYINGHTPFSAIVAFSSVLTAALNGQKYITLSNENSANESTVKDSKVNHQYSKSYEFELDFNDYIATIVESDIRYFSLLRPLTEIQIAKIFASSDKYLEIFRSCNAGSKKGIWCCDCPKCLFVYIILSPFLSQERLTEVFGENLLNKESLEKYFRELVGIDENKPFECVGTRSEVVASLKYIIEKGEKLKLTEKYKDYIVNNGEDLKILLGEWCDEHLVPDNFVKEIRKVV